MAIPRKSRFAERIGKMRGILPVEKDMLRRIGELVDGAINNRGPANPGTQGRRRTVRKPILPPPRGLRATTSTKSALIEWNPVDSPILLFYEVQIQNVETNIIQTKIAFTNKYNFGENGSFSVQVRSVARNGDVSPFSSERLQFTVTADLLFLEGTSVSPLETTQLLIEDIFTPLDYTLFSWGAYNQANSVDRNQTSVITMSLDLQDFYNNISNLAMFRETEMFANVDDATLTGEIRPGSSERIGMWATPMSAMFKPLPITLEDERTFPIINTSPKFYMRLNSPRKDEAGPALSLLSIPAAINTIEEEFFTSTTSIDLSSNPSTSPIRYVDNSRTTSFGVGNQFTIGMWIKIPSWDPTGRFSLIIANTGYFGAISGPLFSSGGLGNRTNGRYQFEFRNQSATFINSGENQSAVLAHGGDALATGTNQDACEARYNLQDLETAPISHKQGNLVGEDLIVSNLGKWIFVAATYNSIKLDEFDWTSFSGFGTFTVLGQAFKHELFFGGNKLQRRVNINARGVDGVIGNVYGTTLTNAISDNMLLDNFFTEISMTGFGLTSVAPHPPIRLYWLAIWDGLLFAEEDPETGITPPNQLAFLANNPSHDLRTNEGDYSASSSLAHWWTFGGNPTPINNEELSQDLGFGVPFSITRNSTVSLANNKLKLKNDRPNMPSGEGPGTGSDV